MSKLNRDSNAYTLGFLAIMAIVVASALAFLSESLKPTIEANKELDRKAKIVGAINPDKTEWTNEEIESMYANVQVAMLDMEGNVVGDALPNDYQFAKEIKKPVAERQIPVFTYEGDETVYVVQMVGMGLWDEISGYLAIKEDKKTVQGVSFDHKGETPGLGAEIVKSWFEGQFIGKELATDNGEYNFTVYKAGKYKEGDMHAVDGVSGATITTNGVDDMLRKTADQYAPFLNIKVKQS